MNVQRRGVMSQLRGMKYADLLVGGLAAPNNQGNECSICLMNFTEQDQIVQLKCSPLHVFHEACLSEWV
jgi:hypothetical protein